MAKSCMYTSVIYTDKHTSKLQKLWLLKFPHKSDRKHF